MKKAVPKAVTPVVVKQIEDLPVPVEVLAASIVKIGDAAKQMMDSGLRFESLVCLLHSDSGVGKPDIRAILRALPLLRAKHTTR